MFSAGVVLYELLTGRLPFDGDNQFVIIHQIVSQEPPPPSSLNPGVSPSMDEVVARALTKNPDQRYASAREFALALRVVAQQLPPQADTGAQPEGVAEEIGQFQANRGAQTDPALRDGSSTGIFGPGADAALVSTINHEAELGAWNAVRDSSDAQDLLVFLDRFPSGIYARRARLRLDQLYSAEAAANATTMPPPQRPAGDDSDMATTIGHYATTLPMEPSPQPDSGPGVATAAALAESAAAVADRKTWRWVAMGGVACGLLALLAYWGLSGSKDPQHQPSALAPPGVEAAPAPAALPSATASATASAATPPASARAAPASAPARTARAAVRAASPASQAASAVEFVPAAPKSKATASQATEARAAPADAPSVSAAGKGQGPSAEGQVCADHVFIFRIACVAEQCATNRYRQTAECIQFKEMEKAREEQRANRR